MKKSQKLIQAMAVVAEDVRLIDLYKRLKKKQNNSIIRVLLYHRISPNLLPWSASYVLHPSFFQWQLEFLKKEFQIIELDAAIACLLEKRPFPAKSVVLTIDDGYKDTFKYAFPLLKKYGVSATLFLTTDPLKTGRMYWYDEFCFRIWHSHAKSLEIEGLGFISMSNNPREKSERLDKLNTYIRDLFPEKRDRILVEIERQTRVDIPDRLGREIMLDWDEIREMSRAGIKIGSHASTHSNLTKLSFEEIKNEVAESKRILEEDLQQEIKFFSYPNGRYNNKVIDTVKKAGYQSALTTYPRFVNSKTRLFEVGRIQPGIDPNTFHFFISGAFSDIYMAFDRIRRLPAKLNLGSQNRK